MTNQHIHNLENAIKRLEEELDQKNDLLEDLERSIQNNSMVGDTRGTYTGQSSLQAENADLKRLVEEKIAKMKEFDQILTNQTIKYEMELKKSNTLLLENRKLKSSKDQLQAQLNNLTNMLEEKDGVIMD